MIRYAISVCFPILLLASPLQAHADDSFGVEQQLAMLERFASCGLPKEDAARAAAVFKKTNAITTKVPESKGANNSLDLRMKAYKPSTPTEECAQELMAAGSKVQFEGFFNAEATKDLRQVPFKSYLDKNSTLMLLLDQTLSPLRKVHACISNPDLAKDVTGPIYFRAKQYLAKATNTPYRDGGPVDGIYANVDPLADKIPMSPICSSAFFEAGAHAHLLTRMLLVDELSDGAVEITRRYIQGAKR